MSNIFGSAKPADEARSLPHGETVGSYMSYLDAQKAVDYLADQQFPVELVAIIGNDLKLVERVTGRLSYPRVALNGALSGMWFGLFVGVLLSFFTPNGSYFSIITSVLMGAAFFMLFGIVTYAMQRGKRDFTSTSQVIASSYDVIVGQDVAHEARRLLNQLPMGHSLGQGGQYPGNQYRGGQYPGNQYPGNQYPPEGYGHQPGEGQPPQPEEPRRPSGWTDPYGVHGGAAAQPEPQQPAPPAHEPRSGYQDLPDGRPQYGIRVDPEHPAPAAGPGAGEDAEGSEGAFEEQNPARPGSSEPRSGSSEQANEPKRDDPHRGS